MFCATAFSFSCISYSRQLSSLWNILSSSNQKSFSLFLVTVKWSAENYKSLFYSVDWWLFLPQHCWKFQGKGLWLEWKWRVNFPHLDIDSNQEQSDPGRVPWENLWFWGRQMPRFTTAVLIQMGEKGKNKLIMQKGEEKKEGGISCLKISLKAKCWCWFSQLLGSCAIIKGGGMIL